MTLKGLTFPSSFVTENGNSSLPTIVDVISTAGSGHCPGYVLAT
jgi:hypothetical protein